MTESNETNKAQVKMVSDAGNGLIPLPETSFELAELLRCVLLAKDYETEEAYVMNKSRIQFIKAIMQKNSVDGWVYLSEVKYRLNSRAYFKELSAAQKQRGIDTFRALSVEMVKSGVIKRVDSQVMLTGKAESYLKELQEF